MAMRGKGRNTQVNGLRMRLMSKLFSSTHLCSSNTQTIAKTRIVLCSLLFFFASVMGINKINNRCNYAHLKSSPIHTFMNINIKSW